MTGLQIFLGVAEIVVLGIAVYVTVYQFTRLRASSYMERLNSQDLLESRRAVDQWLRDFPTTEERLEALVGNAKLSVQLKQFANLFQELGAAYQVRVAHRGTVEVLFDALIIYYWEELRFWVYDYRASYDPSLYGRFEKLYRAVKQGSDTSKPTATYVVGYGSLMAPRSMGEVLDRRVEADEFIPVTLVDHQRAWSIVEHVRLRESGQEVRAVFLDVEPRQGAQLHAVMIQVSEEEMKRLRLREKNYRDEEVTAQVRLVGGRPLSDSARAYCFLGRAGYDVSPSSSGAVILARYVELVAEAARGIDPALPDEIRRSASDSGFEQVSGEYSFIDPVQNDLV